MKEDWGYERVEDILDESERRFFMIKLIENIK